MNCLSPALAVETTPDPVEQKEALLHALDPGPYASTRADGLGGALTSVADTMTAPIYNPAGIGGLYVGKETKVPWVRVLHFPYAAVSRNQNYAFRSATDDTMQKNINKRFFQRASGALAVGVGRFILMGYQDSQLLMIPTGVETDGSTNLDSVFRSTLGIGLGMSLAVNDRFYLGAFSTVGNRTQYAGPLQPKNLTNYLKFNNLVLPKSDSYSGMATHAGVLWEIQPAARPTLSLVIRNIADSTFTKTSTKSPEEQPSKITEPQDVTLGFGLAPQFGNGHGVNLIFEAQRLLDTERALYRRLKAAMEWNFWGSASRASVSLRAGYSFLGASGGIAMNFGLLQFELATTPVDLSQEGNLSMAERRYSAVLSTNLAEW